jgi:SAM-dependent methyltransferase
MDVGKMSRFEIPASRILDALTGSILEAATTATIDGSFYKELSDYVEHDTLDVPSIFDLATGGYRGLGSELLDFGCGTGAYRTALSNIGYRWTGINYKDGMASQAAEEAEKDQSIVFYSGIELPFAAEKFDAVFSLQVFEHLQHPYESFEEIARVLKPGGRLVGSVSYMEQIHDYSTFNFTPYGFKLVCERSGLKLKRVYPQNDVFSFLMRRLVVISTASDETSLNRNLGVEGPFQKQVAEMGKRLKLPTNRINLLRLMFCSNFSFLVEK